MNIPEHLSYSKSHEWVESLPDGAARVGITDFAQAQLGDIVYINLPAEGENVTAGERLTDVESVKAVSDIYSPLTGGITAINSALEDAPELLNSSPYEAWICEIGSVSDTAELMDAAAYKAFLAAEGH